MDLTTLDFRAGVVTHLVVFSAPFPADLTDWLSRIAATGLASRFIVTQGHVQLGPDPLPHAITLELAKDVVNCRTWRKAVAVRAFISQATELAALAERMAIDAAKPMKASVTKALGNAA